MGFREKLLRYCPRPKRRASRLLLRLASRLQIPKLVKSLDVSLPLGFISFIMSVILFIAGTEIAIELVVGQGFAPVMRYIGFYLVGIFVFTMIWAAIHSFLLKIREKGNKILIATIALLIIIPSGFAACLNYGILDSVVLLDGSMIDLSACTALLRIKNSGVTEVQICEVQLGNFIYKVSYISFLSPRLVLGRGENETVAINLASGEFYWGVRSSTEYLLDSLSTEAKSRITPITFAEGKYPVAIYTDGLIPYKFEIEARFLEAESINSVESRILNLNRGEIGNQDYCLPDIELLFEMAPHSFALVYSVEIGNVTIKPNLPVLVDYWPEYVPYNILTLWLDPDLVNKYMRGRTETKVIPSQPLDMPIFKVGETYNVTIRTMANHNYTTTITMK